MKFIKSHVRLFEILFCIFALVLAAVLAVQVAGNENASVINSALGTAAYKTEELEGGDPDADYTYFEPTYSLNESDSATTEAALKSAYAAMCKEAEEEGIVLLKNDNDALPLASNAKVSLFGQGTVDWNYVTSGSSSNTKTSDYATLPDALEQAGLTVNPTLLDFYNGSDYQAYKRGSGSSSGFYVNEAPYSIYPSNVTGSYSTYGDAAIVTISRNSGEGSDITTAIPSDSTRAESQYGHDGSYLSLTETEIDLLEQLSTLKKNGTFKSIIVLLNTSSEVQLDFLDSTLSGMSNIDVDACLWVGNTGSHGILAIGEVLTGQVNPSGRSVDTYLNDNFASPAMASQSYNDEKSASQSYSNYSDYGLTATNRYYDVYVEGIYVGYRYFETRYEDYVMGTTNVGNFDYGKTVAYPFGHGLSYSTFEYSDFTVTPNSDSDGTVESYTVSVKVTNTSETPGKEVVEVYLQKPYTDYDKTNGVEKASAELVGYAKTGMLAASGSEDSSETVEITVDKEQFKTYDANKAETYILEDGNYYLTVAADSHDAVNNILAAKGYTTSGGKMDADGDTDFVECIALTTGETDKVDAVTYSTSTETGAEITNQFDASDPKKYENSGANANAFDYVSRSNWTGTFPDKSVKFSVATDAMGVDLQADNKQEEDGSKKPSYNKFKNDSLSLVMLQGLDYDDEQWETLLDQMTYEEQTLLITDGYHLTNAVPSVNKPATRDENGPTSVDGSVTGYCLPSEGIWAASFNDDILVGVGELMADDCIVAGIQGLYAPGVNIHRTAFIGRSHEYFSEDPYLTAISASAEIRGIQSKGVVAYVKHFAFNEIETNRNGIGIWLNEQSARELYLLPFEYTMRPSMGANVHACMTSFNRAGCRWTSGTGNLLINVARDEWNFDGFFITDASSGNGASYMTYYDGIMGGTNLYDGTGTDSALNGGMYKNSARFCNMMRESCHRIMYVVCNFSAGMNGVSPYTVMYKVTPWWSALLIALEVIFIVLVVAAAAFYVIAEVFLWIDKRSAGGDDGGVRPNDADEADASDGAVSSEDRE